MHRDNALAQTSDDCAWVFGQKQTRNHGSSTVFTGLGLHCILPLPKAEDKDERKAFCYDWGYKWKIETGAIAETKNRVLEVFRGLDKTLA